MFTRGQVLVSSVLLCWMGLSLISAVAHAEDDPGAEEPPVVDETTIEEEDPSAVAVICCDDGGGGTGGGLDFELSVLEPAVPHRYPGTTALGDGYNPSAT